MIEIKLEIYDLSTPDMAEISSADVEDMLQEGWSIAYENTIYDSSEDHIWHMIRWQRENNTLDSKD